VKLSRAVRLVLESFQDWGCLGRTAWFFREFPNGAVLGRPPGFRESPEMEQSWADRLEIRESPEMELSWADRLVIGESPNWSCPGQIA